ncbi:NAD(P)H-dependent oxidoreductase [Lewinella sp. 4G2]|uniref:NAD(P)H-dependent oxidoreductase n=1 Tax=Lewinella sp. 4G2 TaxID=1803372 RepID=UPI0007B47AC5|nr:NAD(P)H-dependent oxidoreductase [Lewinella sp. 4G2]OAV44119.1 NAD(P)H-dependent oxidoreductase [Lewinella sp. 4G2]
MPTIIEALQYRYATKKFDANRAATDAQISELKQAVQLSASSFGLQPYRILVVSNPAIKKDLRAAAYDQSQVSDAGHIFIFAAKTSMSAEYIDDFIKMTATQRDIPVDVIEGYGEYIKGSVLSKDEEFIVAWNKRQAYIALGTLLAAAGELKIDTCPMEGFEPAKFDEILGLKEKGLTACVIAPVGFRSEEDNSQHYAKVRYPLGELFL